MKDWKANGRFSIRSTTGFPAARNKQDRLDRQSKRFPNKFRLVRRE